MTGVQIEEVEVVEEVVAIGEMEAEVSTGVELFSVGDKGN